MRRIRRLVALLAFLPAFAAAQSAPGAIVLRVVDESGSPLARAKITAGGNQVLTGADGKAAIGLRGTHPLTLEIAADGHYPMVHTIAANDARIADIQLVRRQSQRRLLLFAGDAMLSRRYFEPRAGERILVRDQHVVEDGKALLKFVRPYIALADIASVNVETPLTSKKLTDPLPKSVTFSSPAVLAEILEWAGFDYAALGNNHLYDFRDAGLRETFKALSTTSLGFSGAGLDEASARAPYITADGSIAFFSYVGWPGTFSPTQSAAGEKGGSALGNAAVFAADVATVAADVTTVVQQHAGIEYAARPALSERTELRQAIDAGADLAIAHHPHVLQGLEIYRSRLIAYSMGNFLFDQYIYSTQSSMLLYVWLDGDELHRAEIVPLNINGYVPTPATGAFRFSILSRIARLSAELGTCLQQSGGHVVLGSDVACKDSRLVIPADYASVRPLPIWSTDADATRRMRIDAGQRQFRIGDDLLPRGDFEAAGTFGTPVRAWLTGKQAQVGSSADGKALQLTIPPATRVRSGMKVFERAFSQSAPATVSGIVSSDQAVTMRWYLQRRRMDQSLDEALESGPLLEIGALSLKAGETREFAFDHRLPRLATKAVRLLVDIEAEATGASVWLDDLAWIEWRTPWLNSGGNAGHFGTHVALRNPHHSHGL